MAFLSGCIEGLRLLFSRFTKLSAIRTILTIMGLTALVGVGSFQTNRANRLASRHVTISHGGKQFAEQYKSDGHVDNQNDYVASAVAIATLIVLLGQTWIFGRQANLMRRTADIYDRQAHLMSKQLAAAENAAIAATNANNLTREVFVAGQRPWIPAKVEVVYIERNGNAVTGRFNFILENIGQSPAFEVGVRAYMVPNPFDIRSITSDIQRLSRSVAAQSHIRSRVGGNHIFPKGTYPLCMDLPLVNIGFTESVQPDVEPLILALYGQISYRISNELDTDPKFRETSFHYKIGAASSDQRHKMVGVNLGLGATFYKEDLVLRQEFSGTRAT